MNDMLDVLWMLCCLMFLQRVNTPWLSECCQAVNNTPKKITGEPVQKVF
jgi:hypothetical protein